MSATRSFDFVDDVTSDLTLVASGSSLADVFWAAADALVAATVEHPEALVAAEERSLELVDTEPSLLLFRFLNELVYLRDAEGLVLRPVALDVDTDGGLRLTARLAGEGLDPARHGRGNDVKAATLHGLKVGVSERGWTARVTLDV